MSHHLILPLIALRLRHSTLQHTWGIGTSRRQSITTLPRPARSNGLSWGDRNADSPLHNFLRIRLPVSEREELRTFCIQKCSKLPLLENKVVSQLGWLIKHCSSASIPRSLRRKEIASEHHFEILDESTLREIDSLLQRSD